MIWLKQSTAVAVQFGPFLDKADGLALLADDTTITNIDHATTGIFLSKNGGAGAIRHQNVTASVHDSYGMMLVTLDTTDTNTLGRLRMSFAKAATYLPVWQDFMVVPANVWDSMFGADLLDVNSAQVLGTAIHAASENGTQCVEVVRWGGNDIAATAVNGVPKVAVTHVNAAAQTATLDTIKAETALIVADTGELQTDWANGGRLDLILDTSAGIMDAANTELAAIPASNGSLRTMIQWLFQKSRNKLTVTATQEKTYKEDASTVLGTATLSDDGTTFTRTEPV